VAARGGDGKPCSSPACSEFDFWVGEWNLTWTSKQGSEETGVSHVSRILDGRVVKEEFSGGKGGLAGMSVSTYRPEDDLWV